MTVINKIAAKKDCIYIYYNIIQKTKRRNMIIEDFTSEKIVIKYFL